MCVVYESKRILKEGEGWLTGFHRELASCGISFPHASRKLSIQESIKILIEYYQDLHVTKLQLISAMVCPGNPSSMSWNSQLKITRVWISNLKARMLKGRYQLDLSREHGETCLSSHGFSTLLWKCFPMLQFHWNIDSPWYDKQLTGTCRKMYFKM